MFSKIKSFLGQQSAPAPQAAKHSFSHQNISSADSSQCPFINKQNKKPEASQPEGKCPFSKSKVGKQDKGKQNKEVQSESEEQQKPRGGCPFMGGSEKKKNPGLAISRQGYNEPFVSKFKYYLSPAKIDFNFNSKLKKADSSRQIFQSYPIYLQHTLFYKGEDYKKVRSLECCSRFMAYEELRERGNKHFNKGKFYQALDFYERAMSVFRWLEYHEQAEQSKFSTESLIRSEESIEEQSQGGQNQGSKVHLKLGDSSTDIKTEGGAPQKDFQELKEKYKQFFITYYDSNVKSFDGQDMIESQDVDMRKSLLVQIYLNMASAYMNLDHFDLAESVMNDALALTDRVSQVYLKKAQSLIQRKDSSLDQLKLAKSYAEKAIQMKPNQKIFSSANTNILKMLNIHDADEVYQSVLEKANQRIDLKLKQTTDMTERIYSRAVQIHKIQQRMISQGKVPRESLQSQTLYETTQIRILMRMRIKYMKVIEFYTEAKNKDQVKLAKKQFQQILRITSEVKDIYGVNIQQKEQQLGGIGEHKIQMRIDNIKTAFAEDVYNSGKFNYSVLEWAVKEVVKEERQQKAEREKLNIQKNAKSNQHNPEFQPVKSKGWKDKLAYSLLLVPIAVIAFNAFVI